MPTVITAFFCHLTRGYLLARSGENTVRVAKDKYDVLTNHAQTIYHKKKTKKKKKLYLSMACTIT